jgi:hypothetical protein
MIFSNDRDKLRQKYFDVWQKTKDKRPLEPLEAIISDVLLMHPEYHALLEEKQTLKKDFMPDQGQTNPFLHMSMHIAIKEQAQSKRPLGIDPLLKKALKKHKDQHKVEHIVMDCLGESLWLAQKNNQMPNEALYIDCIKKHI